MTTLPAARPLSAGSALRAHRGLLCLLLVGFLAGCGGGGDEGPAEDRGGDLDFDDVETVATGLDVPWAIAFADRETILVTERPGRVRLIEGGELHDEPVAEVDAIDAGEGGLLGIALHPEFPDQRFAYLYYTAEDGNRVSRFNLTEEFEFRDEDVLVTIPSAPLHDGGRIAFGPDDLLYVTAGEAFEAERAADINSLGGKILRLTPEGDVPVGNPFDDSPVFSYGHRNPQGLDWDSEGRLYSSEHGPTGEFDLCCHDEVNLIEAGGFYGWPFLAGDVQAQPGEPPQAPTDPIIESGRETWAPAGLAVHEPDDGRTVVLVANLAGENLMRFVVNDETEVVETAVAVDGLGRLREAKFGPDGCLYMTTSNTDVLGSPQPDDDRLLRVCPST